MVADRMPRVYDHIFLYGDRLTILSIRDGKVATRDDAGYHIERSADRLWWWDTDKAWHEDAEGFVVERLDWKGELGNG